jgi:hypothetical protein
MIHTTTTKMNDFGDKTSINFSGPPPPVRHHPHPDVAPLLLNAKSNIGQCETAVHEHAATKCRGYICSIGTFCAHRAGVQSGARVHHICHFREDLARKPHNKFAAAVNMEDHATSRVFCFVGRYFALDTRARAAAVRF